MHVVIYHQFKEKDPRYNFYTRPILNVHVNYGCKWYTDGDGDAHAEPAELLWKWGGWIVTQSGGAENIFFSVAL